jgi:hypothetical protein
MGVGLNGFGIGQIADPSLTVAALLTNSGTINIFANATVKAGAAATADALIGSGIFQDAFATLAATTSTALASVVNTGTLTVTATAKALAGDDASAHAAVGFFGGAGIAQFADAVQSATASVINSGMMRFAANASATGLLGDAFATAFADGD